MKMDAPRDAQTLSATPPPAAIPRPRRRNGRDGKRRWLPWFGVAVLAGLIVLGFWPKPVPVETAPVERGTIQAAVSEEGKTRIVQRYTVSAPVPGQLRRIPFKAGAIVQAGETVLAIIDPPAPAMLDARTRALAEARAETARANLARAKAARHFAASELKRVETLHAEKAVSVQELEQAQWRETAAAKELAAAESALREAEAELAEFAMAESGAARLPVEIRSPVSGQVLRVFEESSRAVAAGTPLLEIGDPREIEVVIEVLSRDGAAIRRGARVQLHQWGGPQPLEAVVRLVEPSAFTKVSALGVEEQRVNAIADIVTPPEQRPGLGDAFRVEARIVMQERTNTLKAASGALFRKEGGWAAFVVQEGRAKLRKVSIGLASGAETEIAGGLQEGEILVLYPGDRVRDGQRVARITLAGD